MIAAAMPARRPGRSSATTQSSAASGWRERTRATCAAPLARAPRPRAACCDDRLGRVRQQVPLGHRLQERLERGARAPVHAGAHRLAARARRARRRPRGAWPAQVRLGGEVELVEHARLPRRHRRRRRGRQVRDGEQVQVAQPLPPADAPAELLDRRGVVEVAARRHVVHEQVIEDELPRLVDVLRREAEARQDALAEVGAGLRVVLARAGRVRPALAHVVQQRRQEERARARDLGGEARGERELAARARRARAGAADRRAATE